MELKHILITGDTHGRTDDRLGSIRHNMPNYSPTETAVIILGDVGFNYYGGKKDHEAKKRASSYGYTLYCVRGNHEERPSKVPGMKLVKDEFVGGTVWMEDEFPLIRYFTDWGIYHIQDRKVLVVGGAYSVDKYYRLQNGWHWFENEQLAQHEMDACMYSADRSYFDLVLSHTCPVSLMPVDKFLPFIDQTTVDKTMEIWLDRLMTHIKWNIHLWGHYHVDRIEAPHCEIFYTEVEDLKNIEARWEKFDQTRELDWWLPLSPAMKKITNK